MTIIRDGMRRMYAEQEDVYYYVTLMNENYPHPGMPEGSEAGILKGLYQLSDGGKTPKKGHRVQLMGSGTILREVMFAAELLKADFGIAADVWSATSYNELRRDGMAVERWNRLHPTEPARKSHVEPCLAGHDGPGHRRHRLHAQLRRPGARARAGRRPALHGARHRRLRPQRLPRASCAASSRSTAGTWPVAALKALADDGVIKPAVVAEAIAKYGLDAERAAPGRCEATT